MPEQDTTTAGFIAIPGDAEHRIVMRVDRREFGTILAALRYWQTDLEDRTDLPERYRLTAADEGELQPLSPDEIDLLCERINFGE